MTVNVSPDGPGTDSRSAGSREDVGMRYVRIAPIVEDGWFKGYFMDAEGYLAALPGFAAALPPGAREYAEDPAHYYFFGDRCVKDLTLESAHTTQRDGAVSLTLRFAPNRFKHSEPLTIRYTGVVEYTAAAYGTEWWGSRRPGPVQLDEVLPHEAGCRHDIALIGGRVRVVAADLRAEWGGAARG